MHTNLWVHPTRYYHPAQNLPPLTKHLATAITTTLSQERTFIGGSNIHSTAEFDEIGEFWVSERAEQQAGEDAL